jgi:hypothetical protein
MTLNVYASLFGDDLSAPPAGFEPATRGLGMLRGASFKIITSRHKQAILPSRRDFAGAARLVETVHHLPQFLELLRPDCGLATHDHLGTHTLSSSGTGRMRASHVRRGPTLRSVGCDHTFKVV